MLKKVKTGTGREGKKGQGQATQEPRRWVQVAPVTVGSCGI